MAPTADPQPSPAAPTGPVAAPAGSSPSKWSKLTENPLLTVLGTLAVALLILNLNRIDNRISRLEDRMDAGFAAIDDRFAAIDARFAAQDAKFAAQDAKIDKLDAKIDELDRKLTAHIAALNATHEVEAALEGRLLSPDSADIEPERNQAG